VGEQPGFGAAIAVRFVEEGARVVLLSRGHCDDTLALIGSIAGLKAPVADVARWVKADIGSEEDCAAAAADTVKAFGPDVHILVNNAALFVFKSIVRAAGALGPRCRRHARVRGRASRRFPLLPHPLPFYFLPFLCRSTRRRRTGTLPRPSTSAGTRC
jgi:NAD(P)-dependent dehydrogenase (short-subunit alcohol dehydrogenase family)